MKSIKNLLKKYKKVDERYIRISMDLAAQISAHLKDKGWNQAKFAKKLKKEESEISKWLSGTHNFTVKTLALIESVLDKDLFIIPLDINKGINPEKEIELQTSILNWVILTNNITIPVVGFQATSRNYQYTKHSITSGEDIQTNAQFRVSQNQTAPITTNE